MEPYRRLVTDRLADEDTAENPSGLMGRPPAPPGINGVYWARLVNASHSHFNKRGGGAYHMAQRISRAARDQLVMRGACIRLCQQLVAASDPQSARDAAGQKLLALNQTRER